VVRRRGGGGTASIMATVGNNVPCVSRSAMTVFLSRMEIVMRQRGGGCGDKGNNDGGDNSGRNVVELTVTRAGIGRRKESGWGEEENAVMAADG
jgi:hypothetical protein